MPTNQEDELYAQKEELFFAMDEKSHEADLTEKGRNFLQPEGSGRVRAAGLDARPCTRSIPGRNRRRASAWKRRPNCRQEFEAKAQQIHCHFAIAQGLLPLPEGCAIRRPG